MQAVRQIELKKYDNLQKVDDIFNQISEKVQNAENILREFEEMWARWEVTKKEETLKQINLRREELDKPEAKNKKTEKGKSEKTTTKKKQGKKTSK